MILPTDIHAHHEPPMPGMAIVNADPQSFSPREGGWYSVGIHPWLVKEGITDAQWQALEHLITDEKRIVAVGETGLDKLAAAPLPLQEAAFVRQAQFAEAAGKPLVIHLVRAADELLRWKRELRPSVPWIIHGFRGKEVQADLWIRHGFYLSFGVRHQEAALRAVPSDRLLLETDENEAATIGGLYRQAARIRQVAEARLMETVKDNVAKVFFKR